MDTRALLSQISQHVGQIVEAVRKCRQRLGRLFLWAKQMHPGVFWGLIRRSDHIAQLPLAWKALCYWFAATAAGR
jgi:hypothetical protein